MFEKSRKKIVALIMCVLVFLWVSTLGIIYTSSYIEMSAENREMLRFYADNFTLSHSDKITPPAMPKPDNSKHGFEDSPTFRLSAFYAVAISDAGEILEIKNEPPTLHSDEDLKKIALKIADGNKTDGTQNNLSYNKSFKDGYVLITFMDNTVINESSATLIRYTLIFGSFAIIVLFFVASVLAKKIVEPLEASYTKQKQFISDAGHELKTPVSVISVNAELLSRQLENNPWLTNIQYENERMGELVGQLLTLARTENVPVQKIPVDFSRLVDGETLPFESIAFEKGLSLQTRITKGITVNGDSTSLKQVISVLLDNAIRHNGTGNEILLSLTEEQGFAKLSIVNSGEEIPKEQRKRLFERFYRIDTARNSNDRHYGLGLSIAKSIVNAHNGTIEILCYNGLVEFRVQIPSLS